MTNQKSLAGLRERHIAALRVLRDFVETSDEESALDAAIAALSTPHAEGMVLVPRLLTEPMHRAFAEAPAYDHDARKELQAAWDAMIAATTEQTAPVPEVL